MWCNFAKNYPGANLLLEAIGHLDGGGWPMKHVRPDGKLWVEPSYKTQEGEITPGRISRLFPFLCRRNMAKVIIRNRGRVCLGRGQGEGSGQCVMVNLWKSGWDVGLLWYKWRRRGEMLLNHPGWLLWWMLCKNYLFLGYWEVLAVCLLSSENPTKQRVGQKAALSLEDLLPPSQRWGGEVQGCTVGASPSHTHYHCSVWASLCSSPRLGLLPFTGGVWGLCEHWGRTLCEP